LYNQFSDSSSTADVMSSLQNSNQRMTESDSFTPNNQTEAELIKKASKPAKRRPSFKMKKEYISI